MGFKMLGYGARVIKVHCKPSRKSFSGITNIYTIIFGVLISRETFEHIYIYMTLILSRGSVEGEVLLEIIRFVVINLWSMISLIFL